MRIALYVFGLGLASGGLLYLAFGPSEPVRAAQSGTAATEVRREVVGNKLVGMHPVQEPAVEQRPERKMPEEAVRAMQLEQVRRETPGLPVRANVEREPAADGRPERPAIDARAYEGTGRPARTLVHLPAPEKGAPVIR
jgi:hypothetical protein